ncbi:cyclin-Y-like protein 1, partial [Myotis lucifugus]|uniref:cyclin-Y-like protein 1 n=1 Tax=Myotis lucifugus TaxID=59463 RepID=UPI0003C4278F
MGNSKSCCLKASPSPSASPKLDRGSRQVKSKCESEVHEAAARDTRAVETVPATPKSESTSRALKRHHLKNISAPATPKEQDKRKNNDHDFVHTLHHKDQHEIITTDHFLRDPELKSVYRFVCTLFSAEHLTAEYAIVTLIFMERLLDCSNIDITPINWRRILLGSALLAYEYWGKQALWGRDYCQLINNIITVDDMNKIEIDFLRLIRFNIQITGRVYARYYFELLMIAEKYNVHDLFEPFCQKLCQKELQEIFKVMNNKDLQLRLLYPAKISFGFEETVPATPKSEPTSRALKRHHLKNISAPLTPK